MSKRFGKQLLAGPYLFWMIAFTIIPLIMMGVKGLTDSQGNFTLNNLMAMGNPVNHQALILSLELSLISTVLCLLLAYPLALILRKMGSGSNSLIVFLFVLPMWMNFLLRTYSWMTILENNGLLNQLFRKLGIIALYNNLTGAELEFFPMMNTQGAVVLGMVYNYLPFMILPIYSVIVKLDHSLLEAARDLGANSATVFRRVILPLSLPGVLSGITMVFVPSVSTFAISQMLGGGTELLLGDLIERQFWAAPIIPRSARRSPL